MRVILIGHGEMPDRGQGRPEEDRGDGNPGYEKQASSSEIGFFEVHDSFWSLRVSGPLNPNSSDSRSEARNAQIALSSRSKTAFIIKIWDQCNLSQPRERIAPTENRLGDRAAK